MEWLFGKKEEKPKDEFDSIKLKVMKKDELPAFKPLEGSFKMPEKPKIKSMSEIKKEKEVALGKEPFDIRE